MLFRIRSLLAIAGLTAGAAFAYVLPSAAEAVHAVPAPRGGRGKFRPQ